MNEEENDKHEFNFFLDKQIQQKLFEADEEAFIKETLSILNRKTKDATSNPSSNSNGTNSSNPQIKVSSGPNGVQKTLKELKNGHISGWISDPSIVYRKNETEVTTKPKANLLPHNRDLLSSRGDSRNRIGYPNEFVFRHYVDPRKYIEQYRREHVLYDTANSSATKNEFLDSRRFYAYNQYSPLAVSIGAQQNSAYQHSSSLPPAAPNQQDLQQNQNGEQQKPPQQPGGHYSTNKREQKQTLVANLRTNQQQQHSYKLEKNHSHLQKTDSAPAILSPSETPDVLDKKRTSSGKLERSPSVNGVSVQKAAMATKVNVPGGSGFGTRTNKPALPSGQQDTSASPNPIPNQFHGYKLGQGSQAGQGHLPGHHRTLDALACVAQHGAGGGGEKQTAWIPPTHLRPTSPPAKDPHPPPQQQQQLARPAGSHIPHQGLPPPSHGQQRAQLPPHVLHLTHNPPADTHTLYSPPADARHPLTPSRDCGSSGEVTAPPAAPPPCPHPPTQTTQQQQSLAPPQAAHRDAAGYGSGSTSAQGSGGRGLLPVSEVKEVKVRTARGHTTTNHSSSSSRREDGGPGPLSDGGHFVGVSRGQRSHAATAGSGVNQFIHDPSRSSSRDVPLNPLGPPALRKIHHHHGGVGTGNGGLDTRESRQLIPPHNNSNNKSVSSSSVKKRRRPVFGEDESKASLSHKRRIKHLIEQSRLRSRFGQLFGQTRTSGGGGGGDKFNVASSDVKSCWDSHPDGDLDGSVLHDFPNNNNINNDLLVNGTQQSHMVPLKSRAAQDYDKFADSNSSVDTKREKHKNSDSSGSRRDSRTSKGSSFGEDVSYYNYEQKSCASEDVSGEVSGEVSEDSSPTWDHRWPGASPLSRLEVSQRYMDKLAQQLASSVKISVPKLQYSKVGSVDRSQTMHF